MTDQVTNEQIGAALDSILNRLEALETKNVVRVKGDKRTHSSKELEGTVEIGSLDRGAKFSFPRSRRQREYTIKYHQDGITYYGQKGKPEAQYDCESEHPVRKVA